MMQRLEGRIADLAGQLDLMARRPAPEDHGLGMRIEALASRIEDLSNERATLRLEERIENTTHWRVYAKAIYTLKRSFTSDFDF